MYTNIYILYGAEAPFYNPSPIYHGLGGDYKTQKMQGITPH
jgi:hypothetical protein